MNNHAKVLFFATLRDKTGIRETTIEFPLGTSIAEIKKLVLKRYPALEANIDTIIIALDHEFAFDEDLVPNDAELAFFPPVSGGDKDAGQSPTVIAIVEEAIDINSIIADITLPTTGATCMFFGIVRGITSRGINRQTEHLEYEAYHVMAEAKIKQICDEIRSSWKNIEGIAIVQRIGKLMPGTVSVVVACSSSHRDTGIFEAAHYGIDRLKEIVPIWKKEVSLDGEEWIEGEYFPRRGE